MNKLQTYRERCSNQMSSPFQTQSQWENEHETEASFSTNNQKKKGIVVKKKTLMVVGIILALAIASAGAIYMYGRSIEGIWVRQMDDNTPAAGMTVEVRRNNGALEGIVTSFPAGSDMFQAGQIKWFGIRRTGFGRYECYDLLGKSDNGQYYYNTLTSNITVSPGEEQLTLVSNSPANQLGKFQMWIKQKNE